MSSGEGLKSSSLEPDLDFNWIFLVELAVCTILTLFFLFYFNRLFATLVSYGLRAWTWHKYRVYIDLQALQISLLGGRIFFKGLRYHGDNETILIHSGYVTWSYWLRNVRELDLGKRPGSDSRARTTQKSSNGQNGRTGLVNEVEAGGFAPPLKLPCRLSLSLNGVEWFVYNRSPAYDAVLAGMTQKLNTDSMPDMGNRPRTADSESNLRKRTTKADSSTSGNVSKDAEKGDSISPEPIRAGSYVESMQGRQNLRDAQSETKEYDGSGVESEPFILRLLPMHIECVKAAVVLGNENTKSVLITKVDRASGELDAANTSGLDQYRQLINFQFEHPVIQMKPNDDYKEDLAVAGSRIKHGGLEESHVTQNPPGQLFSKQRRKVWHQIQNMVPYFRSSVESFASSFDDWTAAPVQSVSGTRNWQGLSRYLDDSAQDARVKWSTTEYATVSTILDSPQAKMSIYWDVVGRVREPNVSEVGDGGHNINRNTPPEWGINLSFNEAVINYGPWADRQRADIQKVFFPSLCKDAVPSTPLVLGDWRIPTEFKLYIEFENETTLRIPIREESKNWKWTKNTDFTAVRSGDPKRMKSKGRRRKAEKNPAGPEVRPFGWLDIKVPSNATILYTMDMVAATSGYSNKLAIELPKVEITTSVNHGLLLRSYNTRVDCDLSNPLRWNTLRTWNFDIFNTGLELFMLREHIFLFTDLVGDWTSGPPPEYLTFTPFRYLVNLQLQEFKLHLNVNDSNIINNPSDFEDNTFITVFGAVLNASIIIPSETYRPHRNDVTFNVEANTGGLELHVPPWNTQATFMASTEIAQLKILEINGKYEYCSSTSPSNTDTLILNVHGDSPTALFYGFVIRYYLKIKDNYFGDDIRFKTLEEYQDLLQISRGDGREPPPTPPHKKSNDLDVILAVTADNSAVILPANMYSAKQHVRIDIAKILADLRFTNYYMDLDVVLSTLAFSLGHEDDALATPISASSRTQLFIDGITAYGNRIFGLPPSEPTYVCNWDFAIGDLTGEFTTEFFSTLACGARAFVFSFDDDENTLPPHFAPALHDVTFLRVSLQSVHIWMHVGEAAFLISTGEVSMNFNDWAGSHYSKKLKLLVPDFKIGCVDAESASRHRSRAQNPVETHALIQTTISITSIERKLGFDKDRQLQQEHIRRQDQRTHRADFLIRPEFLQNAVLDSFDPPAICVPLLPFPITEEGSDESRSGSSNHTRSIGSKKNGRLTHKSSFLSLSGASQISDASIVRPKRLPKNGDEDAGSRSRGLHLAKNAHNDSHRDVSTSTGRQASFYSATGDHKGMPPTTATFSSSFIAPYFPLEGVDPDTNDLPPLEIDTQDDNSISNDYSLDDIPPDRVDEDVVHISLMVGLPYGVRAVFTPKAVDAVGELISSIQANSPEALLDEFQIESLTNIFRLNKQKSMAGKVMDLSVRTPGIGARFINFSESNEPIGSVSDIHDQYDIRLSQLAITTRSETVPQKTQNASSFHVSFAMIGLSAKEQHDNTSGSQAAINGVIEDVTIWAASDETVSGNALFKAMEVTTVSSKFEYLASLLHRTTALSSCISETISARKNEQKNRVQLFAYLVATTGQNVQDPLFLTRPSYVLRSTTDHLRTTDSWKVIARLHYIYMSMGDTLRRDILRRCIENTDYAPKDGKQQVLRALNKWRSWDLIDLNTSFAIETIYGANIDSKTPSPISTKPIKFTLCTKSIRLILDPGLKRNEISFLGLTSSIEMNSASRHDSDQLLGLPAKQSVALRVFCGTASIKLNWELVELVNDILELYHQNKPKQESTDNQLTTLTSDSKYDLHIVIATETGSVSIDTINLKVVCVSRSLTASFVNIPGEDGKKSAGNLLLAAETVRTKIQSHEQEISLHQLRKPSIYASYETYYIDGTPNNIMKLAANCEELSLTIHQDILALVEALDLVIGDEVARLYQLKSSISAPSLSSIERNEHISSSGAVNKVNIALFLDEYRISILLMQSLRYEISGLVARASISAQLAAEIVFDFDIKQHSHDIRTPHNDNAESISLLYMPPINGRIITRIQEEEMIVSVFASVESIEIDAAAIQSLLSALDKPEIANVVADVKQDIKGIQLHLEEVFGPSQSPSTQQITTNKSRSLVYDAHLTLVGIDIFANAKNDYRPIRLDFSLGSVQFVLANRLEQSGPLLVFPELRIGLQHILFKVSRWQNETMEPCGNLAFAAFLTATSEKGDHGDEVRSYNLRSDSLEINMYPDTASSVVDIMGYLQEKIKTLDLSREKSYLRKLRNPRPAARIRNKPSDRPESIASSHVMFSSMYSFTLLRIQISWLVGTAKPSYLVEVEREDLVLSLKRIDFSIKKESSARLTIEDLQLQMVPISRDKRQRSLNSAVLPEIIFNVGYISTKKARRLAFQAAGKSVDLRLTSQFIIPAAELIKSIASAADKVRAASASWITASEPDISPRRQSLPFFGGKRMESLLVDADFAGAVVHLSGKPTDVSSAGIGSKPGIMSQTGKYGQFTNADATSSTELRSPGLAWKMEYIDNGAEEPSLNAEVKVDASSNTLYPTVVPLILEITSTIKEVLSHQDEEKSPLPVKSNSLNHETSEEENILTADPTAVLGKTRLNLGLRICKQEFTLSCQPIARVAATGRFDDIYMTINTVRSTEHGHFFAASAAISKMQASVQHVYSRESTGSFSVDSVVLSLMNSKHVSSISGISAILKISPMKVLVNAKQLQDFLLFREIWVPLEVRQSSSSPLPTPEVTQSQTILVQRYQQVAATGAFPWNATVSIAELDVQLDLGQAIGKPTFMISNFWVSSKKSSDWEQNLCLGFDKVGVDSTGRMSGFVALQDFKARTSIEWPAREMAISQTPLVQGSLSFSQLRVKAAFEYQSFLVADITSFDFFMYNVRSESNNKIDRLVAVLEGDAVQVYCTTTTASQALALYQAFQRLFQERKASYKTSLSEIENFMRRKSVSHAVTPSKTSIDIKEFAKSSLSLNTNVIVTLKAVNIGVFPGTFADHQVFKLEALNALARFSVFTEDSKVRSSLGLTLGQLRIGLAGVKSPDDPKSIGDMTVEDVVQSATGSRGGTILKVPKVKAMMQTWQDPGSNHIDYTFKSAFEGKVEVGWNYSRISAIRAMWANHSKALAQRLGKPLPPSAVKITGVPDGEGDDHNKITAEVNVPQSKYDYTALEPPVIETPQLRDMGEATPPLTWIGIPKEKLPNLLHQVVIVALLEVASEVEDAYGKILGSS